MLKAEKRCVCKIHLQRQDNTLQLGFFCLFHIIKIQNNLQKCLSKARLFSALNFFQGGDNHSVTQEMVGRTLEGINSTSELTRKFWKEWFFFFNYQ